MLQNSSSKKYMDTYRNNIKRKDNIDNQKRLYISDSDFDNSDNDNRAIKENNIKRTQNKKSIIDRDLINISSSNSSLFEIQNKTTYLRTNNDNNKKCTIIEDVRFVREDNGFDRQNDHNCNAHLIGTNTSVLQNRQEKQSAENFKPHIENVIEGLKYKFSKYEFQISQVQSKYITGNIVTLQKAGDMVFIFSSIISKLKEELTEQQKILENSYLKWAMESISNEQSGCNINSKDMEIESEINFNNNVLEMMEVSLQNSNSNEIFSNNTHRKQSSDTTKRFKKNFWESNKNTESQQNRSNKNRNNETPLEAKDSIVETSQTLTIQTDKRNNLQSKEKVLSLSNLKDNVLKVPQTNSTLNKTNTSITSKKESLNQNVTDALEQPVNSKQNKSKKKEIIDNDSDICSTCSTVAVYRPEHKRILLSNVDKQTINRDVNSDDSESFIFERVISDDEIYSVSDSQDTVIVSSNKKSNFNIQHKKSKSNRNFQIASKTHVALSNDKDLILQKQLNSVPNTNKSSKQKYQVKPTYSTYKDINSNKRPINQIGNNIVDKKLGLICQVVIDKIKQ